MKDCHAALFYVCHRFYKFLLVSLLFHSLEADVKVYRICVAALTMATLEIAFKGL